MSTHHFDAMKSALDEIAALRERLAVLESRFAAAVPDVSPDVVGSLTAEPASEPDQEPIATSSSRRGVLRLAGATAVGAVAAAAVGSRMAAADNGFSLVGLPTTTASPTRTNYTGTAANISGYVFQGGSTYASNSDGFSNAALAGWASSNGGVRDGVYGYTDKAGFGVFGRAGSGSAIGGNGFVGGTFVGQRAALQLGTDGQAVPQAVPSPSLLGMIQADASGTVWLCVTAGTPGTWRKLGGGGVAGSFHAITPGRVYDSRTPAPSPGALAGGTRTLSVANRRSIDDGSVAQADFVPAGATAITCNVTVANTVGAGYLAVNPGGVTAVSASTINWFGNGQVLANGVTLTLNANREVTVVFGGGGSTDFALDVSGYYL